MKKFIDSFHYLTQDLPNYTHIQQVENACSEGAKWVQYRCLSKNDEELLEDLHQIGSICDDWGTTLIVTNHYHLVHQADIQGVHIEDINTDLSTIRNAIGEDKTLGVSASNISQIINHFENSADYISCGPFSHSNTKESDLPHWEFLEYEKTIALLDQKGLNIPIIAAGGIKTTDVAGLLKTGIKGVAVSEAVNLSETPKISFKEFYQLLH